MHHPEARVLKRWFDSNEVTKLVRKVIPGAYVRLEFDQKNQLQTKSLLIELPHLGRDGLKLTGFNYYDAKAPVGADRTFCELFEFRTMYAPEPGGIVTQSPHLRAAALELQVALNRSGFQTVPSLLLQEPKQDDAVDEA